MCLNTLMFKSRFKISERVSIDDLWYQNRQYCAYHNGYKQNFGLILHGISRIGYLKIGYDTVILVSVVFYNLGLNVVL